MYIIPIYTTDGVFKKDHSLSENPSAYFVKKRRQMMHLSCKRTTRTTPLFDRICVIKTDFARLVSVQRAFSHPTVAEPETNYLQVVFRRVDVRHHNIIKR